MVKTHYKNSAEDLNIFMRYTEFMLKGKLFRVIMFFGLALAVLAVALFTANGVFLVCAAIFAAFGALMLGLAFGGAKKAAKRLLAGAKDFSAVENVYTFYEDKFTVENKVKGKLKEKDVFYTSIYRAAENKRFIYLYVNTSIAFIIEKANIEEGSAEELREILRSALGKRCKCKKGGKGNDAAEKRKEK